jgi:pyruvate/2-oxoglutarate dehydrogenase complex dihydrolipoamide acyltransferase (E2) component
MCIGKEQYIPVVDKKTMEIKPAKVLELKVVCDERICDGLYHARAMRLIRKILEHPEELSERLDKVERDVD